MSESFHRKVQNKRFVNIGELLIYKNNEIVWTVLGSCLAIIMYNRRFKLTAICHAQMPEKTIGNQKCSDTCPNPCNRTYNKDSDFRFVTCAIRFMYDKFKLKGIKDNEIEVHLYGGSNIFQFQMRAGTKSIGEQNIEVARKMFSNIGLRIKHRDTGGPRGRRVIFYSETGKAYVEVHKERK